MIDYGTVFKSNKPQKVEVTDTAVFIASNIQPYTQTLDNLEIEGYHYDLVSYTKNEYIKILLEKNQSLETDLLDTQSALCDIYEMLEGGLE